MLKYGSVSEEAHVDLSGALSITTSSHQSYPAKTCNVREILCNVTKTSQNVTNVYTGVGTKMTLSEHMEIDCEVN